MPRRILITGVSKGLGRAMAWGFAQLGHTVVGCARSSAALADLAGQLGPPHRWDRVDVARDEQVRSWAEAVLADGAPDLLINNAALINRNAVLWGVPAAEFDSLLAVNIGGVANVVRHFVPSMIARGSGIIVNFSSGWGRSTAPEVAPYCATKWAVEGLTQALAQELPRGLAAVALNPGIIDTEMLRSCFGPAAGSYPSAEKWARRAVPFLLGLNLKSNGRSLDVPE